MSARRISLRLALRVTRKRLLLGLLLLSMPLFSQDRINFTAYFPAPLAMYTQLLTRGTNTATLLARRNGNVGIGIGPAALSAKLVVLGPTVVGATNQAPPVPPNTPDGVPSLSILAGATSGLGIMDRLVGGSYWVFFPFGLGFNLWRTGFTELSIQQDGRLLQNNQPICTVQPYFLNNGFTLCPAQQSWVHYASDVNGYRIPMWGGTPWITPVANNSANPAGYMLCCSVCPAGGC